MNDQSQVVAWVKELGGGVRYDYECDDHGEEIADLRIPVPDPPCDTEHLDKFATVVRVDLTGRVPVQMKRWYGHRLSATAWAICFG